MYSQLIPIIAPVFIVALLGYGWARLALPFDREFVTGIVMNVGVPCLILQGTTGLEADVPLFMSMMSSVGPSIGEDHGSAVSQRYEAPFPFTGTLHEIEIQLLSREDAEARDAIARAEMSRQ